MSCNQVQKSDDTVVMQKCRRIVVDGEKVIIRDIMGDERVIEGKILMVDLANSLVKLDCQ